MTHPSIPTWVLTGLLWSTTALALPAADPATVATEPEPTAPADASPDTGERPSPSVPSPETLVPASPPSPAEPSAHVGGMVGAAVGVAVPLVVAGVSGAVWQLYSTPDGTFIGNESILKYTVAPIAVVTSLALLPLTTAFGAWVGLVAEFGLDAGLEATLLPALGAGVAAPVGCVGGGMTGGVVGFVAGMLVTVPLVFLAAGSGGGGGIYGLAVIIFPMFVGGAVGLVGGALAGTVGAPLAVVHRGPWGSMSGPIGAQKPEDAE